MTTQNICKIVIVGDGAVGKINSKLTQGKTCLLSVYVNNEFPEKYVPTVFENLDTIVRHKDQLVKVFLWDTAGQEEYDKLRYLSYANSNIFLVAFSVNSRSSFENIASRWVPELQKHAPQTKMMIIGTKSDMRGQKDQDCVSKEEAEKLAEKLKAIGYVECSAKQNQGVQEVFTACIEYYFANLKKKGCTLL